MITKQLERAVASNRYGVHLIDSALNVPADAPASRPRAIGLMACEFVRFALLGLCPECTRAEAV
ncbi:MAG TPA: hypothetical protein VIL92_05740 [Gaiellaceae bacterium]